MNTLKHNWKLILSVMTMIFGSAMIGFVIPRLGVVWSVGSYANRGSRIQHYVNIMQKNAANNGSESLNSTHRSLDQEADKVSE